QASRTVNDVLHHAIEHRHFSLGHTIGWTAIIDEAADNLVPISRPAESIDDLVGTAQHRRRMRSLTIVTAASVIAFASMAAGPGDRQAPRGPTVCGGRPSG